jgi:hypothetical protein
MHVRHLRKMGSTFYETHDGGRRPATLEATLDFAQERRHELKDVPLHVQRLAALGVLPSFRAATAKLVIFALPLPVPGLHHGVYVEDAVLLSRPSAKNLEVRMAQRPYTVEIQQGPQIPAFGPPPSSGEKAQMEPSRKLVCRGPIHAVSAPAVQKPQARGPRPDRYGSATRNAASPAKPEMIELRARSHIPSSSAKV